MGTTQMTPFFLSTFSSLTVCNIHSEFENTQSSFWYGTPFGLFWSVKLIILFRK